MEELDGDEVRVSSRGRYAERDIVQVMGSGGRRAQGGGGTGSGTRCPRALEQPPAGTASGTGWPWGRVLCHGAASRAVGPCPLPWGRAGGPFPGRARRLLPQFVPFRDYVDDSGNQVLSMARLAKDVLAEIPEQLLSYMKTRDIKPRRAAPQ